MEKPLSQQVKDGLQYFQDHPDRVGLKQWRKFKRTVLKPYSEKLMSEMDEQDKAEVREVMEVFGGHVIQGGA